MIRSSRTQLHSELYHELKVSPGCMRCVQMCVCVCAYIHVRVYTEVRYFLQSLLYLILLRQNISVNMVRIHLARLASRPQGFFRHCLSRAMVRSMCLHIQLLYVCWGLTSGHHTCVNSLPQVNHLPRTI